MEATRAFTETIQAHLEQMAASDPTFAERYADPKKNIKDCVTYIFNQVQQSGCNGFCDDEIYGMAVHYYSEAGVNIGKPIDHMQVVVNHVVELTEEEKEEARREAVRKYQNDCYQRISNRHKPQAKREQVNQVQQPSLFD